MTTVLVTGAGGYIGSVLCELLLDAGHEVRALDRLFFGRQPLAHLEARPGFELIREDIRHVGPEPFEGIDVVMHLAGISNDPACDLDPRITQEVNVDGTMRVAKLAREAGVGRFVFSSSCSVYGAAGGDLLHEDSPRAPVSLYARTKIESEEDLMKMHGDDFAVTMLRNGTVYGISPRMRFDLVINLMTLYAHRNRKIFVLGGGQQWRPLVHVHDVARAFLTVMDAPVDKVAGEVFNVGETDHNFQTVRIAHMVRDVLPYTDVELVPDDPDRRSYRVGFDKIRDVLGYEITRTPHEGIVEIKQALERGTVDDGIRSRTVDYYRFLLEAEQTVREVAYDGAIF
jgi:nucleoside-diphosphate-sugar epimerase